MRKTRLFVACGCVILSGAAGWIGCVDSSSPNPPSLDASTFDASVPETSPIDATTHDDATPRDSATDEAAPGDDATPRDSAIDDASATDAGATDAGATDASDASDAGPDVTDAAADATPTVGSIGGLHLTTFRQEHSATLLQNGHVLICGGYNGSTGSHASCEDFDPMSNTVSPGPSMNVGRRGHIAVLLTDGKVLVAGGAGTTDAGAFDSLQSAEIYDPASNTFTLVSNPMAQARSGGGGALVTSGPNAGKVVLVGGYGDASFDSGVPNDRSLGSAEVFDPGANATHGTFTLLGATLNVRRGGTMSAAPLPEGGVLAAGGSTGPGGGPYTIFDTAETLDPLLGAFTATANAMSAGRQGSSSVVLPDGRVVVANGMSSTGYASTVDTYDPATRSFAGAPLPAARDYAAIAALKSGRVMIAGGVGASGTYGDVIVFDPTTHAFVTASGTLNPPRSLATATTLLDGRVIVVGGQAQTGFIQTAIDVFSE